MLDTVLNIAAANRVVELERVAAGTTIEGDFEGSVTASWVRLDPDGSGVVRYKEKLYVTQILGSSSVPTNTSVELSHANGIYYSKY